MALQKLPARICWSTYACSSIVALTAAFVSFLQTYKIYIYKVLKQVHPVRAPLSQFHKLMPLWNSANLS